MIYYISREICPSKKTTVARNLCAAKRFAVTGEVPVNANRRQAVPILSIDVLPFADEVFGRRCENALRHIPRKAFCGNGQKPVAAHKLGKQNFFLSIVRLRRFGQIFSADRAFADFVPSENGAFLATKQSTTDLWCKNGRLYS